MPEIIVKLGDNIVQKNFFVKEAVRIGRSADNEIVIENLSVSRAHATIQYEDGHYLLSDLDSSNGTYVNGVRIKKTELLDRDVITIGKHRLYFYDQRSPDAPVKAAVMDVDSTMMFDPARLPVAEEAPPARVQVLKGRQKGKTFVLKEARTTLGRGGGNDIRLSDWFVSKEHAVIERRGNQYVIQDMDSWRHTIVNGQIVEETVLEHGALIQLGPTVQLQFTLPETTAYDEEARPSLRVPVELDDQGYQQVAERTGGGREASGENRLEQSNPLIKVMPYFPEDATPRSFEYLLDPALDPEASTPPPPHESGRTSDRHEESSADQMAPAYDEEAEEPQSNSQSYDPFAMPADSGAEEMWALLEQGNAQQVNGNGHGAAHPPAEAAVGEDEEEEWLVEPSAADRAAQALPAMDEDEEAGEDEGAGWDAPQVQAASEPEPEIEPQPEIQPAPEPEFEPAPAPEPEFEPERAPAEAHAEAPAAAPAASAVTADMDPKLAEEILMWERALTNKNAIIRKQAARRLKQLTGMDYEY